MFFKVTFLAALPAAFIVSGCGGGQETLRVSPTTLPDPRPMTRSADDLSADDRQAQLDDDFERGLELLTVHFEYDRYELTPEALDILSANCEALVRHARATIRIEGHCDERGTEEYNMALGYRRAQAVRAYLLQYGIDPSTLSIISFGESRPVDPAHHDRAWGRNRRADFVVLSP